MTDTATRREQVRSTGATIAVSMALKNRRAAGLRNLATIHDTELAWLLQDANEIATNYSGDYGRFMRDYYWPISDEYNRREWIALSRAIIGFDAGNAGGIEI